MKLITQENNNSCNIACIEMILQHYNVQYNKGEIIQNLPKHTFGSFLPEIGVFLQQQGIQTSLIINQKHYPLNKAYIKSVERYKLSKGLVILEYVKEPITKDTPIIIQIDRAKLTNTHAKKEPHYIVIIQDMQKFRVYDPTEQSIDMHDIQKIIHASLQADIQNNNGGWLICEGLKG